MERAFIKYINKVFERLNKAYNFRIKTELNNENSYAIEYISDSFVIKIEKYFREFYAILYKLNEPDSEINLFTLIGYLRQGDPQTPQSEYFRNEMDVKESYRKQLNHISSVIYDNYNLINVFFNKDSHKVNMIEFEVYWKNKHPEFYKKT